MTKQERKIMKEALGSWLDKKEKLITIVVEGGCVVSVHDLPEGYKYEIKDYDVFMEEEI